MGYLVPPMPAVQMVMRPICAYCGIEQFVEHSVCPNCGASETKWVKRDPRHVRPIANMRVEKL